MAGLTLTIDLNKGLAEGRLADLQARMADPRPFYEAAGNALLGSVGERFRAQIAPEGSPWTPLSPRTIKARTRRGRSAIAILRETGLLAGSIAYQVREDGVEIGSTVPYSAIHQFGGTIEQAARGGTIYRKQNKDGSLGRLFAKKKNKTSVATPVTIGAHSITIPARPYLGLSADDQVELLSQARRWLAIE